MAAKRKRLTKGQRLAVHTAACGLCHICGTVINLARETFEIEHVIPIALGGEDAPSNWRPAHVACHKEKTKSDITKIAKAKRVSAKHEGTYRPSRNPLPASKKSRLKKRLDGSVVDRDTGEIIKEGWKK